MDSSKKGRTLDKNSSKSLFAPLLFALVFQSTCVWGQAKVDPKTGKLAQNFIGTVTMSRGKVELSRKSENQKTMAIKGVKVHQSDMIRTQKSSFVRIIMVDKTVINLGPKSIFKFDKFKLKKAGDRKSVYNLIHGKLRTAIKKKAKPGDILIKAGSVAMGIRGTEIVTQITKNADGSPRTKIALVEGKVQVDARKAGVSHTKFFDLGKGVLFDSSLLKEEGKLDDALKHLPAESMRKLESVEVDNVADFPAFLDDIPTDIFKKGPSTEPNSVKKKKLEKKTTWRNELQRLKKRQKAWAKKHQRDDMINNRYEKALRRPASSVSPKGCRQVEECLEFKYHEIRGKLIPFCKQKVMKYEPEGCSR